VTEIFLRSTRQSYPSDPVQRRFEAAVYNTGNYFFEEAVASHMPYLEIHNSLEGLPQNITRLVLSMSNFISPAADLTGWCEELESRKIDQMVMIGAGAQAYRYDDIIELRPETRRFLDLLADKSVSIGVRGFYTAEILNGYGIKNIEVIGCPTAFWNEFPRVRSFSTDASTRARLAIHCTPDGNFRDAIGALFKHGFEHQADYVVQSEAWMMPYILPEVPGLRDQYDTNGHSRYYTYEYLPHDEFERWMGERARIYFGMSAWIEAMKDYDLVYGARFHGNMAAIMAGTPALNMPFDTRTREMVEYLNLPHIPLEQFRSDMPLDEIANLADYSHFQAVYPILRQRYVDFLARNGLAFGQIPESSVDRIKRQTSEDLKRLCWQAKCDVPPEREAALRMRDEPSH
jgi:hypothetical protein